ncbi:MAG: site-2 protease family protein [Thiobacillus sp.]|nr:site-2 protease family protein [Thiobacillus sp.]
MLELTLIQKIAIFAIPVIFAITLHEAAHGFIAMKFGDKTAWMLGRVTANPIKHIDPFGTIGLPLLLLLLSKLSGGGAFLFGWAKPVPVNFSALRHPKRDMIWVAAAGPGANLLMALFWGLMIQAGHMLGGSSLSLPLMLMGGAGIFINAILAALNLLPLPPLDGGRIAVGLLPRGPALALARIEPYGIFILLGLLFTGLISVFTTPLINFFIAVVRTVTGLSASEINSILMILLR